MRDWRDNTRFEEECRKKAKELVSQMTLTEKVFQTLHPAAAIPRLGIKAYNYWNEALHGVARAGTATVFPQAIGLAAMFDEDFVEKIADAISTEGRAKYNMQQKYGDQDIYKGLTFWSPNVNIFRDPRWGRGHETFGEDPWLSGRMGVRFVEGLQGHDEAFMKAAACAKHFAVHSGPEPERHCFDAKVSEQDLRETYLPAFKACVKEAGVEAVMGGYNRVNGEPACANKKLLEDILRGEWQFKGHVVSDCWAISDFHQFHHVTDSWEESAALAMNHGCDLNCGVSYAHLIEAAKMGLVTEESITKAVERLMACRIRLGLIAKDRENPYDKISYLDCDSDAMRELNREAARKSVTLLKNENHMLPLCLEKLHTIGVVGPNANSRAALTGNYEGTASRYITVLEGIQDYVGDRARVLYAEGCHLYKDRVSGLAQPDDRLAEAKAVCEKSDVVIAVLGLDATLEGEQGDTGNEYGSGDKPNLDLPGRQQELLEALYASKKPVILVLLSGSALAVNWADEHIPAIVQGWYPGAQGGAAIAQILFGAYSPEGKLPVTFYRTTKELPDFSDYSMQGRTYRYMKTEALYPFGYGLSYSRFEVSDCRLEKQDAGDGFASLCCSCRLTNLGDMAAAQTVQVYVQLQGTGPENPVKNVPNWQLKGLKKVLLQPKEAAEVTVELPIKALALYEEEGKLVLNSGEYAIYIGISQPDERSAALLAQRPVCMKYYVKESVTYGNE